MPLHPEFEALFAQFALAAADAPPDPSAEQRRAGLTAMLPVAPEIEVGSVEDREIPGPGARVPLRIYAPAGPGPFPLVMYFHGGGWVIGDLDTHDAQTREVCRGANCVVVAVDYRRAPEHTYPAAADDCYAATCWAVENAAMLNVDPDRVAVVGDSAGGNLATAVALMARDRDGPNLCRQVLVYPVTDTDFERPSYSENAEGYLLTRETMIWFWDQYCPDPNDRDNPYAAPMRSTDLSGLPAALVLTGEYDPLRDEGEAYAERLAAAGVPVEQVRYDGFPHFFIALSRLAPAGQVGMERVCATLRDAWVD